MEDQNGKNGWSNFRNVLILSVGFMLLMAAWLTTAAIEVRNIFIKITSHFNNI